MEGRRNQIEVSVGNRLPESRRSIFSVSGCRCEKHGDFHLAKGFWNTWVWEAPYPMPRTVLHIWCSFHNHLISKALVSVLRTGTSELWKAGTAPSDPQVLMTEWGFELASIRWPPFWPLSPNCFPVGDSPWLIGSPRVPLPWTSSPPSLYLTVSFSFIPHLSSPLSGSPCLLLTE